MKQKLLALLLIALLMPLCTWASLNVDDTFTDNGIMYKVISTSPRKVQVGIGTTSATAIDVSTTGKLQIPSSVKGTDGNYYSVTSIGDYAFYYCNNLTSIVIPSSVISIGIASFDNCKGLTDIVIGNSVESIGGDAFFACSSLTNINIPKSVKKIDYRAFHGCKGLTSIVIPNSVMEVSSSTFAACSNLASIEVESGNTVYDSRNNCNAIIESAKNRLVTGCKNTIIPDNVEIIENQAFWAQENLTSIRIPKSVRHISSNPFERCYNLISIVVDKNNTKFDSRDNCNAIIETGTNKLVVGCESTVIPNTVESIGTRAFSHCGLKRIEIPKSVKSIEIFAFEGQLESIVSQIEEPSVISDKAFTSSTLNSCILYVPEGTIDAYTSTDGWKGFKNVRDVALGGLVGDSFVIDGLNYYVTSIYPFEVQIGNIDASNRVIPAITDNSIAQNLSIVNIPATVIGPNNKEFTVTNIVENAFYNCTGLKEIHSKIENPMPIGWSVFRYDLYETATLYVPNKKRTIYSTTDGWNNFRNIYPEDADKSLAVGSSFTVDGITYQVTYPLEVQVGQGSRQTPAVNRETKGAITIPSSVETNNVSYSVTAIGDEAFYMIEGITSVEMPNTITAIGARAFCQCSLSSINIPNSVRKISTGAFLKCEGITSVRIPKNVISIENEVFAGCNLSSITVESSNPVYDSRNNCNAIIRTEGNWLIQGCKNTVIPNTVTLIGTRAFEFCEGLTVITIPNSVTTISSYAFGVCPNLTAISIPSSVTNLDNQAFSSCVNLASIVIEAGNPVYDSRDNCNAVIKTETNELISGCKGSVIPNTVTSIGRRAFWGMKNLNSLEIPNSVTSIGESAFSSCESLESLVIPSSVETIGKGAFHYCKSLTKITIPTSVTSIGDGAFYGCNGLSDIHSLIENPFAINKNVFQTNSSLFTTATLHVPFGTKEKYASTEGWKEFKNIVEMRNTFTLTYMVDGTVYKEYSIDSGEAITPEAEPTKEGYTFSGWSEIPETMPANDVTVTGTFAINKYTLTYKVDNEEYKTYEVEYSAAITPEAEPTKEGYTFSGWSEIPETMPANDVTVTGTFAINKYTLTYKVDNEEYKTYEVEYGTAITPEAEPTKEGYTFSGWSEIPETMPANDVTVTGTFAVNKYTLTYKVDGEEYKTYEVEYGAAIIPESEPTKEGYTFSGWSEIPETMPANDVTIIGTFTENPIVIDIEPVEAEENINVNNLDGEELSDKVVGNVYYNVGDGGYDSTDKSIVISQPTNMSQIANREPGSKDVKENFNGMILKVAKGKGLITVNVKTSGNAQLVVQVGNGTPMLASKTEKGDVVFRYDVEEDTYVYIYAIIGSSAAKGYGINAADTESSVRIYGITVSPGATGIRSIGASEKDDAVIYDLQGHRVETPAKGIYIIGGRKVAVK